MISTATTNPASAPRAGEGPSERQLERLRTLRRMAIAALPRMLDARSGLFGWCIRRGSRGDKLEGQSHRYTAIVLLGLSAQRQDLSPGVFGKGHADECCDRLLDRVGKLDNLGDVALTLWAGVAMRRRNAKAALDRLKELSPAECAVPTVELAWALSALSFHPEFLTDEKLARATAKRLKATFNPDSALFTHHAAGTKASALRAHVSCFADWVYPVQALAFYHDMSRDAEASAMARRAGDAMIARQGSAGQWWWHYDARTGRVMEKYPVYSVHQEAMAPMALLDLMDRCGGDDRAAILKGVDWMFDAPECGDRLVDEQAGLIWRKVARYEPGKLVRGLQAGASFLHPSLRCPLVGAVFPARKIDYECRPYHLGWLLYAFSDRRLEAWGNGEC